MKIFIKHETQINANKEILTTTYYFGFINKANVPYSIFKKRQNISYKKTEKK